MTLQPDTHPLDGPHDIILTTITYICLCVSLIGLTLTIFALGLQRSLRRLDMTKVHIFLACSLLFGYIVFLVGIDQVQVLNCILISDMINHSLKC